MVEIVIGLQKGHVIYPKNYENGGRHTPGGCRDS